MDALCNQQDDPRDKLFQLPRMSAVYGNAKLGIVSVAGRDANATLWTCTQTFNTNSSKRGLRPMVKALADSVWETVRLAVRHCRAAERHAGLQRRLRHVPAAGGAQGGWADNAG